MPIGQQVELKVVTTLNDYLEKGGVAKSKRREYIAKGDIYTEKGEAVLNILALDVAKYVLRRTGYICGSHYENINSIRRDLINKFETQFG